MTPVTQPRPLAEHDDRSSFDCGRESLNLWFRRHAWNNHVNGTSRVNVVSDATSGRLVGYVTLSAAQIERAFLPKAQQRNRPDPVPVALLGQLAVDSTYQRQGHGPALLLFALKTALRASETIACAGVLTHPLDDEVRSFYRAWGFEDLPLDPRGAMFVRMADLRDLA